MYDGLHPTVQNTRSPTCAIRTKRKKSKKAKKFFRHCPPSAASASAAASAISNPTPVDAAAPVGA